MPRSPRTPAAGNWSVARNVSREGKRLRSPVLTSWNTASIRAPRPKSLFQLHLKKTLHFFSFSPPLLATRWFHRIGFCERREKNKNKIKGIAEDWRKGKESGEIIAANEGRMCIKWWRIIKWRIINGLRGRVKNKGEEGEGRLKGWKRCKGRGTYVNLTAKYRMVTPATLISRLCSSLDSNGIVFWPFLLFLFLEIRSWDIRLVCVQKCIRGILLKGGFWW